MTRAARVVAGAVGATLLVFGLWAFLDAPSFYDQLATYPPYNRHFLHDLGAFQVGLGATLLLATVRRDSLDVALGGAAAGAALHAVAHVWDRDLGGRDSDPWFFVAVAAVLAVVALARWGRLSRRLRP